MNCVAPVGFDIVEKPAHVTKSLELDRVKVLPV
jgi:sulfur carrier protein ThiS